LVYKVVVDPKVHDSMSETDGRKEKWQAVVENHALESHDPEEWLRYGIALSQLVQPSPQQRQQQQQAGLAFVQAQLLGASAEDVKDELRYSVLVGLTDALKEAGMADQAETLNAWHERVAQKRSLAERVLTV
jgi:hypothetical protein